MVGRGLLPPLTATNYRSTKPMVLRLTIWHIGIYLLKFIIE